MQDPNQGSSQRVGSPEIGFNGSRKLSSSNGNLNSNDDIISGINQQWFSVYKLNDDIIPPEADLSVLNAKNLNDDINSSPLYNTNMKNEQTFTLNVEEDNSYSSEGDDVNVSHINNRALNYSYFSPGKTSKFSSSKFYNTNRLMRFKTKKVVELSPYGIFSVDIPVPEKVIATGKYRKSNEFTHLRYTAVCSDPDEFINDGYKLRVTETGRAIELMVAITLYNEDDSFFINTWTAIEKNIKYLCNRKDSSTWNKDSWQRIIVVIIADGRHRLNPKTLTTMGLLGVYQDGLIKTSVNGKKTICHLFEYTTQVSSETLPTSPYNIDSFPIQTIFCLKEDNLKKINSHRWFFNAFSQSLNPMCCILIDVGTKPTTPSFYRFWKAFYDNPRVAGVCGEVRADTGRYMKKLWNPLVAAQHFEYKIANLLDKPMESMLGFISVLPGAFSAYRYKALKRSNEEKQGPLDKYFLGEKVGLQGTKSLSTANMYLAEDRVLCFELVSKPRENWVLKYIVNAKASTDVPSTVTEFVGQRRRWLNGSLFSALHSLSNFRQIFRSSHSWIRKLLITIDIIYIFINFAVSWFGLANFFLIFYFLGNEAIKHKDTDPFFGWGKVIFIIAQYGYLCCTIITFTLCLGNRPQGNPKLYLSCFIVYGLWMIILTYITIMNISISLKSQYETSSTLLFQINAGKNLFASILSTYGSYVFGSLIYLEPWHLITSLLQYTLLLPSLTNILMMYAFCNIHDVSWGTKGVTMIDDPFPVQVNNIEKSDTKVLTAIVDLPINQSDIDEMYEVYIKRMKHSMPVHNLKKLKPPLKKRLRNIFQKNLQKDIAKEDYFKSYRTNVLLLWIFSNLSLVIIMLSINNDDLRVSSYYFAFILVS